MRSKLELEVREVIRDPTVSSELSKQLSQLYNLRHEPDSNNFISFLNNLHKIQLMRLIDA